MKMATIDKFLNTLQQMHQEIEHDPNNQKITEKISQVLDDNSDLFKGNIEIAIELDAIAAVIKTKSRGNPLIQKIRGCVQQILPDEAQSRNQTLDLLRSKGDIRQIAEWIELMDVPVDALPLTPKELFEILGSKLKKPFIAPSLDGESLGKITEELLKHKKKWNDNEKAIVIALAKYCAKTDGLKTADNVKKFGIEDPKTLIEIAKLCAQQNAMGTALCIRNFHINEEATLVEIAKLCAQHESGGTAIFCQSFGIQDPKAMAEIAKICAQQDGAMTAEHIQNFGIRDEEDLVEIAKLCAQQNGYKTAECIKLFGIQNQAALVEIAKLCAQQNGWKTALFIQNFGIQNQDALVEIAKLCAKANGEGTAQYIQNFGIQNEDALVEIAKLCAQQNGAGTASNFKNFGIQNQDALVEIAKLCANRNTDETAGYIQNFGIQNSAAMAEIAKHCANLQGMVTAFHIKNFGIQDPATLLEIAKLCAQQNGRGTAEYIKKFRIQNAQHRLSVCMECIIQSETALRFVNNFAPFPEAFQDVFETIQVLENNDGSDQRRSELFKAFHYSIAGLKCQDAHKAELQALCDKISGLDPYQQRSQAIWFLRCLVLMNPLDQRALDWTIGTGLLKDLSALRDPQLRQKLSVGLFELAADEKGRDHWSPFISQMPREKGLRLLSIPLFCLECKKVHRGDIEKALQGVLKPKIKKDALKIQRVLHMMYLFASTPLFNHEQRVSAFSRVFLESTDETQILEHLIAAKGLLQLKETAWAVSEEDLGQLFRAFFEKTIPLEGFQGDVSLAYDKFFASSRYPEGLITYAAGLKTLNDPELIKCLGRFIVSVFDGTFQSMRYDGKNNPHLAKIYEARPDLQEKWPRSGEMQFQNVSKLGSPQEEMFDAKDWLRTKLIVDKHLGQEDLTLLEAYLDATSDEVRKAAKKNLTDALSQYSKGKKRVELDQDPKVLNLKIQLACINLAMNGNEVALAKLEEPLKAIQRSLNAKGINAEFVNDVTTLHGAIVKPEAPTEEILQAVITDGPADLLFVGMDVQGSCQRLDGTPNLNKGLLGYLMDGKNQVLAIKDRSGKMVARAMLRLMWDGQQPVLYRERFYPATLSTQEKDAMNQAVTQLAKALNVVITSGVGGESYGKPLHSLGGPAPWEYSDANGGVQRNGIYTISDANVLTG